jgi:6-pyruvoyltetrahydropterin/6-carboxytetrahydropterin synthase
MFKITKEFSFCAAHQLNELGEGHPCSRVHGHNYKVKVELKSNDLDSAGMVQDYGELKEIGNWIDEFLDHRNLNNVIPGNPTAENIAKWIFYKWKHIYPLLSAVDVSETDKTWARYEHTID